MGGGAPARSAAPRRDRRGRPSLRRAEAITRARAARPGRRPRRPRCRIAAPCATILIVEDEFAVARGIQYALQQEGYEVTVARSGEEGLEFATSQAPDLIVLDVRLPGMDGFEVLRRLRAVGSKAPVLFLTARGDEVDKVVGLELGADDYVTKPFGLRELMSRIRALLRRAYGDLADAAGGRVIRHGDLVIDLERRRVQRGDAADRAHRRPSSRSSATSPAGPAACSAARELLELLRDYEALDQDEKTINVHVSHLRDKIEDDPSVPQFVLTVRGAGYAVRRALTWPTSGRPDPRPLAAARTVPPLVPDAADVRVHRRRRPDARPRRADRRQPDRRLLPPAGGAEPAGRANATAAVIDLVDRDQRRHGPGGRRRSTVPVLSPDVRDLLDTTTCCRMSRTASPRPTYRQFGLAGRTPTARWMPDPRPALASTAGSSGARTRPGARPA